MYNCKHTSQLNKGGVIMGQTENILQLAMNNNGIVTSKMVTDNGLSKGILKYLYDNGKLEKIERGIYILPNKWEDEMYNLQLKFSKGIFSHETALFLLGVIDRTPINFDMTFPKGYNLTNVKKNSISTFQTKIEWYEKGIIFVDTPLQNKVRCYCAEKTLCDILKPKANTDIQVISQSFKNYTALKNKNISLLSQYAQELNVYDKVKKYLEVLL